MNTDVRIEPVCEDLATTSAITTRAEPAIQTIETHNEFPAPRELSGRRVGYLYAEIVEGAHSRPRFAMLPPTPGRKSESPFHAPIDGG